MKDYAWYTVNAWDVGDQYAHEVGTKKPNPWGLFDMHGNVSEWVQDGDGAYPSDAQIDPAEPEGDGVSMRVVRGGNFSDGAWNTWSAIRYFGDLAGPYTSGRGSDRGARLLRIR